jgi:hypothetical protein
MPKNARTHSPAQVAQIVATVSEFGRTTPILTDSGGVITAGPGRSWRQRRWALATVPCIVLGHLTPALLGKSNGNHQHRATACRPPSATSTVTSRRMTRRYEALCAHLRHGADAQQSG